MPYVLISADHRIAGCYTLSSTAIRAEDLPEDLLKQLKLPRYPVIGATLLGRLARDLSFAGQGLGELLLVDALKRARDVSRTIASIGVLVDAKDNNARLFYQKYGFIGFTEKGDKLLIKMEALQNSFPN